MLTGYHFSYKQSLQNLLFRRLQYNVSLLGLFNTIIIIITIYILEHWYIVKLHQYARHFVSFNNFMAM